MEIAASIPLQRIVPTYLFNGIFFSFWKAFALFSNVDHSGITEQKCTCSHCWWDPIQWEVCGCLDVDGGKWCFKTVWSIKLTWMYWWSVSWTTRASRIFRSDSVPPTNHLVHEFHMHLEVQLLLQFSFPKPINVSSIDIFGIDQKRQWKSYGSSKLLRSLNLPWRLNEAQYHWSIPNNC